jgi:hypothetical protein
MGSRRGHGEGSIYQRESDGYWCTSVDLGYVNGKRKVIYRKTRKEVADKLRVVLRDQQQRFPVATQRQGVNQFLTSWLENVVKGVPPTYLSRSYNSYTDCSVHTSGECTVVAGVSSGSNKRDFHV